MTSFLNHSIRLWPVVLLLVFGGWSCSSTEQPDPQTESPVAVSVETARLEQSFTRQQYSGTVRSQRTVNLSTKMMGRVTELSVDEGDYVSKGTVLVRIKDDNLQAQKSQVQASLQEARAGLKNTETNYNRLKALYESESATKKELDDISMQYEMAQAKVKALEAKLREINDMLDYTVLEAPFNGFVVAKNVSEGDMAAPGHPLLTFEQESRMKVDITVPETQIDHFASGDTVSVDIRAAGLQNRSGIVTNINPSGNRASRQFTVEVRLAGLDNNAGVKSGMYAQVSLMAAGDASLMVPQSAIVERGQLTGIYTLNSDSEVLLRWVRLGEVKGENVEVLSGLAPGERYISSIDNRLREGQKVNIQ